MHLGLVLYGELDRRSGGYLYDHQLVSFLRAQGDHVTLFSLPWRSYPEHLSDNLSPFWRRTLKNASIDILLQDELNHPSLFWLNRTLQAHASYPLVSIVHHLRSSERQPRWQWPIIRWVERHYLNTISAFICNSQTTRDAVFTLSGARRPSLVARPAADHHAFSSLTAEQIQARAQQPGPLQILFVGNLIPRKGLHSLLAASRQLPPGSWRLRVVGDPQVDPAYTAQCQGLVAKWQLADRVDWLGRLSNEGLYQAMQTSHVLAVPSSYEGFGIVYLEGMAAGLPPLATTAGGAVEIIAHDKTGYLTDPDDVTTLRTYLHTLAENRERLARMGIAAQAYALTQPGWQETGSHIRTFLQDIVA